MKNAYELDREFFNGNRVDTMATAYVNGVVCEDCEIDEPEDMTGCTLYVAKCKFCKLPVTVSTVSNTTV